MFNERVTSGPVKSANRYHGREGEEKTTAQSLTASASQPHSTNATSPRDAAQRVMPVANVDPANSHLL
jgi:hypothetical protein